MNTHFSMPCIKLWPIEKAPSQWKREAMMYQARWVVQVPRGWWSEWEKEGTTPHFLRCSHVVIHQDSEAVVLALPGGLLKK